MIARTSLHMKTIPRTLEFTRAFAFVHNILHTGYSHTDSENFRNKDPMGAMIWPFAQKHCTTRPHRAPVPKPPRRTPKPANVLQTC